MSFKLAFMLMICGGFGVSHSLIAQVENDVVIEQIIESIAENTNEDFDYSEVVERLNHYRKNPINVNKTNRNQLRELLFLSPVQINELMSYIETNGQLIELYELQSIQGFDLKTIRNLLNFITVGQQSVLKNLTFRNLISKGNNDLMIRYSQILERQVGYTIKDSTRSRYLGSPQKIFTRYRYAFAQNISAALTMEKDAGEQFFKGAQSKGFDFYSGNIAFRNLGAISKLVIGDYSLQFGQGLNLWSGLSFGKGADITTIAKQEVGLKPYTSVNEALFFRGISATVDYRRLSFTPFISYRNVDAGLNISTIGGLDREEITSLSISGLHRTPNEANNRNDISQLAFGGNLKYAHKNLEVGATAYHTAYEYPFEQGKSLYNKFEFASNRLTNVGLNYNYAFANSYVFGEFARSLTSGIAYLNGILTSISPQVSVVIMHRNYQKNYHSFFNQGISEAGTPINEKGFYSAVTIKPNSKWEWVNYVDFFSFPWLKFGVDAPSKGFEILSQINFTPNKRMRFYLRYRQENKQENDDVENTINTLEPVQRQNYRGELSYKLNDNFSVKNRVEVSQYRKGNSRQQFGFIAFQDIIYNPLQSRFSGNLRFALFDTPGYDTRIYTFENDVLYSYSFIAYQNSGLRTYINGRYTVRKGLDIWARYSLIAYADRETVGSGLEQINGNKKSDLRLQIRLQF